jgi:hypothetical protein
MSDSSIRDMLAREAAEAEARADAEERGEVEPARGQRGRRPATDPSQVYAVRIPVSRLRELRAVADQIGVPPTTLIREWVIERLDKMHDDAVVVIESGASAAESPPPERVRIGPRRRDSIAGAEARSTTRRKRQHA